MIVMHHIGIGEWRGSPSPTKVRPFLVCGGVRFSDHSQKNSQPSLYASIHSPSDRPGPEGQLGNSPAAPSRTVLPSSNLQRAPLDCTGFSNSPPRRMLFQASSNLHRAPLGWPHPPRPEFF